MSAFSWTATNWMNEMLERDSINIYSRDEFKTNFQGSRTNFSGMNDLLKMFYPLKVFVKKLSKAKMKIFIKHILLPPPTIKQRNFSVALRDFAAGQQVIAAHFESRKDVYKRQCWDTLLSSKFNATRWTLCWGFCCETSVWRIFDKIECLVFGTHFDMIYLIFTMNICLNFRG